MRKLAGFSFLITRLPLWPLESQQGSRRNAMIATNALAQRRAEREDVEDFLASRAADAVPRAGAVNG